MSVGASIEASGSTSRTLLQRVRRQDPAAWERFTRIYGPLVYRWCAVAGLKRPGLRSSSGSPGFLAGREAQPP